MRVAYRKEVVAKAAQNAIEFIDRLRADRLENGIQLTMDDRKRLNSKWFGLLFPIFTREEAKRKYISNSNGLYQFQFEKQRQIALRMIKVAETTEEKFIDLTTEDEITLVSGF